MSNQCRYHALPHEEICGVGFEPDGMETTIRCTRPAGHKGNTHVQCTTSTCALVRWQGSPGEPATAHLAGLMRAGIIVEARA